jgi:4-amino-4-deoxy-L-arabinose transferase-like glycosyltransferase
MNLPLESVKTTDRSVVENGRQLSWRLGLALLFVLALATALRIPATQRGFFFQDEATYLFGVQPGVLTMREAWGLQNWPRPFMEHAPFDRERAPYFVMSGKPGYDLITMLFGSVVGLTPESISALSLLFGIGTLVILYRMARSVFDDRIALAAIVVLAVSKYHVFYSGSQSSVAMATFFVILGIHLYLSAFDRPTLAWLALAGASLAYGFGCHYNMLPYVLLIFGIQTVRVVYNRGAGIIGLMVLGLSFLSVIGVFELFYRIILPAAYSYLSESEAVPAHREALLHGGYLAQLRWMMGWFRYTTASGIERFPTLLLDSEGVLVCGLTALGGIVSLRSAFHDWRKDVLLLLPAAHFVSGILAGLSPSPVFSRMTVVMLPFVALWAGVGAIRLADWVAELVNDRLVGYPAVPIAAAVTMAVVAAVGIPRAWEVANLRSGYQEAAQYVLEHGGGQEVVLGLAVEQFYLGSFSNTYPLPNSLEALRELYRKTGVRLLVLDRRVHSVVEWGGPLDPAIRDIERTQSPEARFANPMATALVVAAEETMGPQALAEILADPFSKEIRIYDLTRVLGDRPGGVARVPR